MRLFINISIIFTGFLLASCAATKPAIPKYDYLGPDLPLIKAYSIEQVHAGATMFLASSPEEDTVLLNLYEPDGKLGITLYHGQGGILVFSLAILAETYGYEFKPGQNKMFLFGTKGKAEFDLQVQ